MRLSRVLRQTKEMVASVVPHERHLIVCTGMERWSKEWPENSYARQLQKAMQKTGRSVKVTASNTRSQLQSTTTATIPSASSDIFLFPENIVLKGVREEQFPALAQYISESIVPLDPARDIVLAQDAGFLESLGFVWQSVRRQRHIFVCSHGEMDERCGRLGSILVAWMRDLAKEKGEKGEGWKAKVKLGTSSNERVYDPGAIQVWKSSHVGGHDFAGNILVYPHGHWFGRVRDPETLDLILTDLFDRGLVSSEHWRGRLGLQSKEEQQLYHQHLLRTGGREPDMKIIRPNHSDTGSGIGTGGGLSISFKNSKEQVIVCKARVGERVLDTGLRYQVDGIEGSCGGNLECATCHVWVKGGPERFKQLGPISETEQDLLDATGSNYREGESRLCCQIRLAPHLNQLIFEIPSIR